MSKPTLNIDIFQQELDDLMRRHGYPSFMGAVLVDEETLALRSTFFAHESEDTMILCILSILESTATFFTENLAEPRAKRRAEVYQKMHDYLLRHSPFKLSLIDQSHTVNASFGSVAELRKQSKS